MGDARILELRQEHRWHEAPELFAGLDRVGGVVIGVGARRGLLADLAAEGAHVVLLGSEGVEDAVVGADVEHRRAGRDVADAAEEVEGLVGPVDGGRGHHRGRGVIDVAEAVLEAREGRAASGVDPVEHRVRSGEVGGAEVGLGERAAPGAGLEDRDVEVLLRGRPAGGAVR